MLQLGRKKIFSLVLTISLLFAVGVFFAVSIYASSLDLTVTVTSGPVCGNSIIETGEQCDNGSSNGSCPATCSASCQTNSCGGPGDPTPALEISGLSVANITASGANISWTTNRAALCSLQYGINTAYASSTITETGYSVSHLVSISGLTTSTTYHYKINCADASNYTAVTGDNVFTTTADTPPLAISNLAVLNITKNSADVSWKTNRPAICGLRWGINTDYSGGASSEIIASSTHISLLTGLAPDTDYHYIINCQDSLSFTASSGDKIFKTLLGPDITPPGNVLGLRSQSGNTTSTLFWRNPADLDYAGVIIRRAIGYYPNFIQGTMVYQGQGNLIGSEFSFADTGLTNGLYYYYSVFSYDLNNNHSAGVGVIGHPILIVVPPPSCATDPTLCPPPTCATDPSLCPPPPSCATDPSLCPPAETCATNPALCAPPVEPPPGGYATDLLFSDFNFFQQGQPLTVGANNRVTAQPDLAISVVLPQAKILAGTDKLVLNLSIGGKVEAYLFSYEANRSAYVAIISPLKDTGTYFVNIIALNAADQALKAVSGLLEIKVPLIKVLPSLPETIDSAVAAVEEIYSAIREAPAVKAIAEAAASPAGQSAAAATMVTSFATTAISIPLLNWWFLLQFLFTQPLGLLWFRKGWGTVYNAITKKPIDLALVRFYDAKTNRLIASRVTDKHGRYIFLVNPGEYYLKVEKSGFDFPSDLLKRVHDDGSFLDLYYGEKIIIAGEERSAIIANIPLDQQDAQLTDAEVLRRFSRARLSRSLSWLGPILALGYFLFYPSIFSFALIVVHFLMFFLFRRLAGRKHKKHWGVVYAPDGKNPIKQAITRIFSSEYGRMLEFYVTDDRGRYGFLVSNNKYYVTADKPGYGTAKTPVVDLTGKKLEELVVAQDLVLPQEGEIKDSDEKTPEPPPAIEAGADKEKATEPPKEEKIAEAVSETEATAIFHQETPPVMPSSLDLGSLDKIREQMENKQTPPAKKPPIEVENKADESEIKPATAPDKTDKPEEGIYG